MNVESGTILYLPVRKGSDSLANDEPLNAITYEAFDGPNEEEGLGGEAVGCEAGENSERFPDVFSDGEIVELELGEGHEGLEGIGVVGEGVVVAGDCLDPYRRHEP